MTSRSFHFYMTILWGILVLPTIFVWRESLLWIALISVYANVVGHWGAYQASRGEEATEAQNEEPGPT